MAASVIGAGGLVVFPTDTVYGLGTNPFDEAAVRNVFEAKGRSAKPIPVLCGSTEDAQKLVELSPKALQLAGQYWPGALTIVAPLKVRVPSLLHQGTGTLGVRVPASAFAIELIRSCGGYLTGTSANASGKPSSRTPKDAAEQLGDSVQLILDGGPLDGAESTVVKVVGDDLTILRQGPVRVSEEISKR
jgi:L-threonylcarbamoyladenylate synthase